VVRVDVLGPIRISIDGRTLDDLRPTGRALIADLALAAGRVVSAEQLIDDLWGSELPANPKGALRVAVSRARKLIGGEATLAWEYGGYRLDGADVDAVRFDAFVADGRQALADDRPVDASALFADALSLWSGEALADVRSAPFAVAHAARLEAERIAVLEQRVEADLACGRHLELVGELAGLVSDHPLQERLWAHRMVALYRAGRQADALRVYGEVRTLLAERLGLEPGHALRALEESILLQRSELDFVAAVSKKPVSDASVPPVARPPAPLSGLVGRKAELDALLDTVDRVRLVTLVGPAGVGKTRLAVETVARHQDRDAAEVWVVELGLLTDAASVGEAIAMRTGSAPSTHGDALRAVAARLHERRGLLLLDNCERVRAAVAAAVDQLLATCRQLTILATSRVPLVVDGEEVMRLAPLPIADAVALFETRSGVSNEQAGSAMAAICEAVDGLPLAVELAAGLTRTLTVEQVAERIGDRFQLLTVAPPAALPHHQTLRAALEWGHDLLGDDDRALYRRLAVFAGGWTLDAAEAVCAGDVLARGSVAPSLARLVDASLVTIAEIVGDRRFTMLDTLGHFAAEQLDAAGETDSLRGRHLDWCHTLAERADSD
jgi:predicted ATPase/DNA-binding SARP family transcriptional activator